MSELDKTTILNQHAFFQYTTDAEKKELYDRSTIVSIPTGRCVFSTGQDVDVVALLGKGMLRVYLIGETGREITLYYVHPGESCPTNLMCALFDRRSPAEAVPIESCEALVIPKTVFKGLIDKNPQIRWSVMDALTKRLVDIMSLVEEVTFRKMDLRLSRYLNEQFASVSSAPPVIRVTHEAIARELGSAREVISRLLTEFSRQGIVELSRGEIILKDAEALADLC